MTITHSELVAFCAAHNIKHTNFGRKVSNANIVSQISKGRTIGQSVDRRIKSVMAAIVAGEAVLTTQPKFKRTIPAVQTKRRNINPSPDDAQHLIAPRWVCFNCGVRSDVHDAMGCKRWRAGE